MLSNIEQIIENLKKANSKNLNPDRIVFGIGIGESQDHKNPGEAFFRCLCNFERNLGKELDEEKRSKILESRNYFISTYKQELLPDESPSDILQTALNYCNQKIMKRKEKIEIMENDKNNSDICEESLISDIARNQKFLTRLQNVQGLIFDTLEQEKGLIPTEDINCCENSESCLQ